jgi:hypothetical protein
VSTEINTSNLFMVGMVGDGYVLMKPPRPGEQFTPAEALNLAAYLVAMAEEEEGEFQKVLDAVQGT